MAPLYKSYLKQGSSVSARGLGGIYRSAGRCAEHSCHLQPGAREVAAESGLPSPREGSCPALSTERAGVRGEGNHTPRESCPILPALLSSRATFFTRNSINTTLLHNIYFETSFGGKLQCEGLELVFHQLIKKCQSFMIHNSEIYFKLFG